MSKRIYFGDTFKKDLKRLVSDLCLTETQEGIMEEILETIEEEVCERSGVEYDETDRTIGFYEGWANCIIEIESVLKSGVFKGL